MVLVAALAFLVASGCLGIREHVWWVFRIVAALAGVICIFISAAVVAAIRRPRVAYGNGCLQLDLGAAAPFQLPLDVVECFFLGQGPSFVGKGAVGAADASNVVVRLAERATEWHKRDVRKSLGHWCDGYITIRGAWCEPINGKVVEQMNSKLATAKRARKADTASDVTRKTETN